MKQTKLWAMLAIASFALFACEEDEKDNALVVTFEGESWNQLIDSPQYGGPLLYPVDGRACSWTDTATSLTSTCEVSDWTAWGYSYWGWSNGIAISNYVEAGDLTYDKQLSVPASNGSKNFAVVFSDGSAMQFSDGKKHVIRSIDFCPTTYCLSNMQKNAEAGYEFKVVLASDAGTTMDVMLAKGSDVQNTWKRVSLSGLGAVNQIIFTFDGSDKGDWGLNTPRYVAIDNIVVEP